MKPCNQMKENEIRRAVMNDISARINAIATGDVPYPRDWVVFIRDLRERIEKAEISIMQLDDIF